MEDQKKETTPEDSEDIPSDFFDDFNKDDFIEGLSVVDSWDEDDKKSQSSRKRIHADAIDSVRDLRELIGVEEVKRYVKPDPKYKWTRKSAHEEPRDRQRSGSYNRMDDFIKPGSRRDPNKTNQAIKKDKEVKVKEYLAKHLESSSELCPPGTELDDFFEDHKTIDAKKNKPKTRSIEKTPTPRENRMSPARRHRYSPAKEERKVKYRGSPPRYRREHWSPRRQHYSPHHSHRSDNRYNAPRKPYIRSPRHDGFENRRERYSRSPIKYYRRHSRSRSGHRSEREHPPARSRSTRRIADKDDFLYPKHSSPPPEFSMVNANMAYHVEREPQYPQPIVDYGATANYSYAPVSTGQAYSNNPYGAPFDYGVQPHPPMVMPIAQPMPLQQPMPIPQPVPAPIMSGQSIDPSLLNPMQPVSIPPQVQIIPSPIPPTSAANIPHPNPDALAKLVADGTLSHEDYLKLAPNKGFTKNMDLEAKNGVMKRCLDAMSKLGGIMLPNQLVVNNTLIVSEMKQIAPKFCSPLKRQSNVEFSFTKYNSSAIARQNKLILDSIITALGVEKVVGRSKKVKKETRDAAVQTMKPFCDVCEIRESMKFSDAETSIDRESFCSTVHTQVVDQDLFSSKSVFNPTGVMADGANISIAHMTPAQLVSQLAARAKTLKQSDSASSSSQYRQENYNYDGRGAGNHYRRDYNYR